MTPDSWLTIVSLLLGGGGVGGALAAWTQRQKSAAEVRETQVRGQLNLFGAAGEVVELLREELERLGSRVLKLEELLGSVKAENADLKEKMRHLETENRDLARRCAALERENEALRATPAAPK